MSVIRRWTEFCLPCDSFVFTVHKGRGTRACRNCGAKLEPVVLVPEQQLAGAVSDRDALRLMLSRLLDVALVDGYGETVADEARALLTTTGGQ